jgi:hypothetical protein
MTVIQMSGQELTRLRIMIDLADGRITVGANAALMGLGRRQVFRLRRAFAADGASLPGRSALPGRTTTAGGTALGRGRMITNGVCRSHAPDPEWLFACGCETRDVAASDHQTGAAFAVVAALRIPAEFQKSCLTCNLCEVSAKSWSLPPSSHGSGTNAKGTYAGWRIAFDVFRRDGRYLHRPRLPDGHPRLP